MRLSLERRRSSSDRVVECWIVGHPYPFSVQLALYAKTSAEAILRARACRMAGSCQTHGSYEARNEQLAGIAGSVRVSERDQ